MRVSHDHSKCFLDLKSKSVYTKAHVQHIQNKMNTISLTSEILGNYAKILKYDKYFHGHSLITVLSQVGNKISQTLMSTNFTNPQIQTWFSCPNKMSMQSTFWAY